jgi:hypothetical protein
MSEQPRTRQDLYDQIRQSSNEEFILDEMIRLGFWPAQGEIPNDPADEIRRRGVDESIVGWMAWRGREALYTLAMLTI